MGLSFCGRVGRANSRLGVIVTDAESDLFQFRHRISANDLCESWSAARCDTGAPRFVKVETENTPLDRGTQRSIVQESERLQGALYSRAVVTSLGRHQENGRLLVEYPYLPPESWQDLTRDTFWHDPTGFLRETSVIIDYLHQFGLVHRDLKLSNFMVNQGSRGPRVVLADLDFLCEAGSHPLGTVVGTERYIAPEVRHNEIVVEQSDCYSYGVMIQDLLRDHRGEAGAHPPDTKAKLALLADDLTDQNYLTRPRVLTTALATHGVFDAPQVAEDQRRVLSMFLLSQLRSGGYSSLRNEKRLRRLVLTACRVIGLPDELLADMAEGALRDGRKVLAVARNILECGAPKPAGGYWQLSLSDDDLWRLFGQLKASDAPGRGGAQAGLDELVRCGRDWRAAGEYRKSFLAYREGLQAYGCESGPDAGDDGLYATALTEAADAARLVNRVDEAEGYLTRLLEQDTVQGSQRAEYVYELARANAQLHQLDRLGDVIEKGLADGQLDVPEYRLRLRQLSAWLAAARGEHEACERGAAQVQKEAVKAGHPGIAAMADYTIAISHWRRGENADALRRLETVYRKIEKLELTHEALTVMSALIMLYGEVGRYRDCIRLGRKFLQRVDDPSDGWRQSTVLLMLVLANTRIGDYAKAEHYCQRYFTLIAGSSDRQGLGQYLLSRGFIEMNRGNPVEARHILYQGLHALSDVGLDRNAGKFHQNLAEIALVGGDLNECRRQVSLAREQFDGLHDAAAIAEANLIKTLAECHYAHADPAELAKHVDRLVSCRSVYFAILAAFHYYVLLPTDSEQDRASVLARIDEYLPDCEAPVARALKALRVSDDEGSGDGHLNAMQATKKALYILTSAGNRFAAALVSALIARRYAAIDLVSHAGKFYDHAYRFAGDLRNTEMQRGLNAARADLPKSSTDGAPWVRRIFEISRILQELPDTEGALQDLVQFAVYQTGAERGVLLRKKVDSDKLLVLAAVECDDDSLHDIEDFSRNAVASTLTGEAAMIIENALDDQRTRNYRSIAMHNILSIACVPLKDGDQTIGALYLDHHTIPSLFGRQDIEYITAIANFVATAMRMARALQSATDGLRHTEQELKEELGATAFVTQDPATKKLLEGLLLSAPTNVPIMLQGETGTGKTILAKRIHELSGRTGPMISINCASVPETLIEDEFFGHVRGAFSGANQDQRGKFEAADGGTLFLDEISEMSPAMQAKLLHAVEVMEITRLGSHRPVPVDVRIISASNQDVKKLVERGKFRRDLFYRLCGLTYKISPLRERPGDIPSLIDHFHKVKQISPSLRFTDRAMDATMAYHWPGNAREVLRVVEQFAITHRRRTIDISDLWPEMQAARRTEESGAIGKARDLERIREALIATGGNQAASARLLGMPAGRLRRLVRQFDLLSDLPKISASAAEREARQIRLVLRVTGGDLAESARRLSISEAELREKMRRHGISGRD